MILILLTVFYIGSILFLVKLGLHGERMVKEQLAEKKKDLHGR